MRYEIPLFFRDVLCNDGRIELWLGIELTGRTLDFGVNRSFRYRQILSGAGMEIWRSTESFRVFTGKKLIVKLV